jgi:hypothetical protein
MNDPTDLDLKLGARPPRHDDRTLQLATYLTPEMPAPPVEVNWLAPVNIWPMFLNDRIGDCTCAAAGHLILGWTANTGQQVRLTDSDILGAYEAVTGYNPADPSSDQGAVELDVLNYWRRTGIAGHKPTAYVRVDHTNSRQVRQAISLFGGVYIGAALPTAARDQFRAGQTWRAVIGPQGRKGSWGGHALGVLAYGTRGLTAVTWGTRQHMTWSWWSRYVVECYGIVSVDFLDAAGRSPQGLDLPTLLGDLAAIEHSPT